MSQNEVLKYKIEVGCGFAYNEAISAASNEM
jgi:hypothetical protein